MIGAEIEAAKLGGKLTWEGIKVVLYAVAFLAVAGAIGLKIYHDGKRDQRLEHLEAFKSGVDAQVRVSDAGTEALQTIKDGQAAQQEAQTHTVIIHERLEAEAAHEDPDADAWLRARIPDSLLRADAAARAADRQRESDSRSARAGKAELPAGAVPASR